MRCHTRVRCRRGSLATDGVGMKATNARGWLATGFGMMAILAGASAVATGQFAADGDWHDGLHWQDRGAGMRVDGDGYALRTYDESGDDKSVAIHAQPLQSHTASVLFDGLFALAQQEMQQDQVTAIRDDAFDHGKPLACDCYKTGDKWPYVWTRDVSYSADLALARLDPQRMRRTLRFKLSDSRSDRLPQGLYVAQDTGSGGSWPISTDRVVWFLGARHLLDDPAFAKDTWRALRDTLAQDREYAFDPGMGLYRGETSFLDWREQTYPAWTANDVRFIAESYALSTNVLHYQALQLAATLAQQHEDRGAADTYRAHALALATQIDRRFWNPRRGMYMSYIGSAMHPVPVEAYDLLGISLAALSGAVPQARARESLANYPVSTAGSPVIWPQRADVPIYHNRAIWPFVSAYAFKAARKLDMPGRIAFELRSIMRGTALAGSNMENYELTTQRVHVDDGKLSGPVVNSPRQLWSVAAYLDMVIEGVFGVQDDGTLAPKIPVVLAPMLFGDRGQISLQLQGQRIILQRPKKLSGNLLVAGSVRKSGADTLVQLRGVSIAESPLADNGAQFAPSTPAVPKAAVGATGYQIDAPDATDLYVNDQRVALQGGRAILAPTKAEQCLSATKTNADGIESLHSPTLCLGQTQPVEGAWPRSWTAQRDGRYRAALHYDNPHGPINTGITAAVKRLSVQCGNDMPQVLPIVMPHSVGEQLSTSVFFSAKTGQRCMITLLDGTNMSDLNHFARYTSGLGGETGSLNEARIGALDIMQSQ